MKIKNLKDSEKANGTSFHNSTIVCTVNQLKEAIGEPVFECNTGEDKSNFDWECELEDGTVFTVYDWKLYEVVDFDEWVDFHIGGFSYAETQKARKVLINEISKQWT